MMSRLNLLSSCKKDIIDIYESAIQAIRPENLIKNAVSFQNETMTLQDPTGRIEPVNLDLRNSGIHVIGGGKSVLSMATGLADLASQAGLTRPFSNGAISIPEGLRGSVCNDLGSQEKLKSINVRCLFGSKSNLPDQESVNNSEEILSQILTANKSDSAARRDCLFIVLLSGGGSSCLTIPRYINLEKKLELIKYLVQKGADIVELNKVRRYFSKIKGGQLASFISNNCNNFRIVSLILSDVIGDELEFIASGPTVIKKGENYSESMLEILRKYNYPHMDEVLKHVDPQNHASSNDEVPDAYNFVIGNNEIALEAAITKAKSIGYHIENLGNNTQGYSEAVMERLCQYYDRPCASDKVLTICGGEVTIRKLVDETWGLGGRVQEMALDYIIAKLQAQTGEDRPNDIDMFLAGTTDGQDGPTDVAACMASYAEYVSEGGSSFSLGDVIEAKRTHDSYNFWTRRRPQWLVKTGLTGTNVMDLYMHLKCHKSLSNL